MPTNKPLPKIAQWSAGLALLAVALTAGALSLAMNIAAGLAIGATVAIAFGLSDVAKILIPVTCQAIGWNLHLKTVYAVAAIVSVVCAGLYLADQFGENIAAKENAATITANTDQQIEDLRASIATARKMADDEAGRGGCGPKCQALNDRVAELETALSDALRQRQSVKASDVTDGKAIVIAGALGTGEAATSRSTSLTLIFAALLIGELCAHLAGAAAVDAYGEEDVPKTNAGTRTVPLGSQIIHLLKEWKLRTKFAKPDHLVFPNRKGGYANHYNMINRDWNPLFEKVEVKRFNWHALRHFAVSTWIEADFSPKAIQTFAGHSSLQVTMDRYGHLFPAADHSVKMNQISDELFGNGPALCGT